MLAGALSAETRLVALDVAVFDPSVFVAVTATFSVWSTSLVATLYVFDVAPEIALQLPPVESHCCH